MLRHGKRGLVPSVDAAPELKERFAGYAVDPEKVAGAMIAKALRLAAARDRAEAALDTKV